MMNERIEAWHFLRQDRRFRYDDGTVAEVGRVYSVDGPIKLCARGLHASVRAIDALQYAPGPVVGRVILSGDVIHGDDKIVATRREYLWIADATETLWAFSRWCALQVIDWWDAPYVVRQYLESGDEKLRAAARDATYAAVAAATYDAVAATTRSAAHAAYDAVAAATYDAVVAAIRSAAHATYAAVAAATYDAVVAKDAQNAELEKRLFALKGE